MQRSVLDWSGVPVEHGSYARSVTIYNLGRGARSTIRPPRDLLDDWTDGGPLFAQLRNVVGPGWREGVLTSMYQTDDRLRHACAATW